jgi:YD repeat-containing protein
MLKFWLILGGVAAIATCAMGQGGGLRYFYDDANELFRVLDSTGTLVEYIYDASGNITQINRSTVPPASLAVLNITPLSGTSGQTVTIYGQNFSSTASSDMVQFGGVAATVISASSTALVVQIPPAFPSGQVSVTVNGVTANSGTLAFTPPPAITSISVLYGVIGQTLTGVVVQGFNLAGATFTLPGGGVVTPVTVGSTQATLNITLGQTPGPYVLIATSNSGPSTSIPAAGNYIIVYNTAGNNYSDLLFSVFNATGPMPDYPPGTNRADLIFSVFNPIGPTPNYPAGTNQTSQLFSVFNPIGPTPDYPAGSHEAWQLFSTQNPIGASPAQMLISMAQTPRRINRGGAPGETLPGSRPPVSLIAGQSVEIALRPSLFLHYLEIDADNAPLASSTTGSLSLPFTVPFGVDSFSLRAFGFTSFGTTSDALAETVRVVADPDRIITGRVPDASGAPVPGAVVTWQAQGLAAEYYRFGGELSAIPELRNGPARLSFLGALNYPNPQQVFGADPMGVGLGANYGARLSGKIQVDTAGIYELTLRAHAGARLTIDGQILAEAVAAGADASSATGSASLSAGAHEIEVTHFESGGAAALQLLWTPPGGEQAIVPPAAITAEAPAMWRAATGSDGRFVLHVPAALDGVVVKLVTGTGSVEVDR